MKFFTFMNPEPILCLGNQKSVNVTGRRRVRQKVGRRFESHRQDKFY